MTNPSTIPPPDASALDLLAEVCAQRHEKMQRDAAAALSTPHIPRTPPFSAPPAAPAAPQIPKFKLKPKPTEEEELAAFRALPAPVRLAAAKFSMRQLHALDTIPSAVYAPGNGMLTDAELAINVMLKDMTKAVIRVKNCWQTMEQRQQALNTLNRLIIHPLSRAFDAAAAKENRKTLSDLARLAAEGLEMENLRGIDELDALMDKQKEK